eukprot:CAMPEP_0115567344 /NCGR_PEP_ID=MMETSP0271-20121206/104061_1 /TAXON_ID=71861 /ORGANISM="Scrippsiella trochoidea, Strain CCMP3099" /LENGTH=114 /DNA_ID=CAMNT_0003001699 /DNA_START=1071 /DNA_END=1412 /DNA_ORIENTATION=-
MAEASPIAFHKVRLKDAAMEMTCGNIVVMGQTSFHNRPWPFSRMKLYAFTPNRSMAGTPPKMSQLTCAVNSEKFIRATNNSALDAESALGSHHGKASLLGHEADGTTYLRRRVP